MYLIYHFIYNCMKNKKQCKLAQKIKKPKKKDDS